MAITATQKPDAVGERSATQSRWNVIATLDADITLSIPHGMGSLPGFDSNKVFFWGQPTIAEALLSNWLVTVDSVNLIITKTTAVGSGSPSVQMVLFIQLPHSIL